jgi:hypothetical protein
MARASSLDVLVAQLEVQLGRLSSLLVTSPRAGAAAAAVAEQIARGLLARGVRVRLLVVTQRMTTEGDSATGERAGDAGGGLTPHVLSPAEVGSLDAARAVLSWDGVTVAAAEAILDAPAAVFLAATAGAVVLAVERASTARRDVERARGEIEAAGGRLVAGVLRE